MRSESKSRGIEVLSYQLQVLIKIQLLIRLLCRLTGVRVSVPPTLQLNSITRVRVSLFLSSLDLGCRSCSRRRSPASRSARCFS